MDINREFNYVDIDGLNRVIIIRCIYRVHEYNGFVFNNSNRRRNNDAQTNRIQTFKKDALHV